MKTLLFLFALAPASAETLNVNPGEAAGLTGPGRETALLLARSHYENMVDAFTGLVIDAPVRTGVTAPAKCLLSVDLSGPLPEGAFVEGAPVRKAQPLLFNRFQVTLMQTVTACARDHELTPRGWETVRETARELFIRNSGTSYCRADADCEAYLLSDPCSSRPASTVFVSHVTDIVFMTALRMFLPSLLNYFQQSHAGDIQATTPPGAAPKPDRCAMPLWEMTPLPAACDAGRCKLRR